MMNGGRDSPFGATESGSTVWDGESCAPQRGRRRRPAHSRPSLDPLPHHSCDCTAPAFPSLAFVSVYRSLAISPSHLSPILSSLSIVRLSLFSATIPPYS